MANRSRSTARADKPMKGRAWVALGLLAFIIVASAVVWRRSVGAATAGEMAKLQTERRALLSKRVTLMREIRQSTERRLIVPAAESKLGLHVATESQTRMLADSVAAPAATTPPQAQR